MKSRWIAALFCLLYLSVSTVIGTIHQHGDDSLAGTDQCAACAWHHDHQADLPAIAVSPRPPLLVTPAPETPGRSLHARAHKLHPGRGPPSASL